jgi:general stress protein 26
MMSDLKQEIYEVIKEPQLMSLATITTDNKPWVRYVTGRGNPNLNITFVTSMKSRKIAQIQKNPEVHINCGATDLDSEHFYLQIQGRAEVSTSPEHRNAMWRDTLKAYFSGPADPDYCVCIVKPYYIEYYTSDDMIPQIWKA